MVMKNLQSCSNLQKLHHSFDTHYRKISAIAETTQPWGWVHHISYLHKLLQRCAKEKAIMGGKLCHGQAIQFGYQSDTLTANMLINMYSKCGLVDSARRVFDEMPERSPVSWNTMIGSYTQNGNEREALDLFIQMQRAGTQFGEFTVSAVLCACAAEYAVVECKQLHAFALKADMLTNTYVGTSLLDVYAKCNLVDDATRVFKYMPEKSAVTWSSMVAGYVQNELYEEALVMFRTVQVLGVEFNQFTISSVISACAAIAARIEGIQAHVVLYKTGFQANFYVASALVDMYSKCASIREAYVVFSSAEDKNIVLFNAMISGLSRHARSVEAMLLFEKMQQMGLQPSESTYVSVLSSCAHMGLVNEGRKYFGMMREMHNISPNAVHYSCMVDVLGRTGLVYEAKSLIDKMPFTATASMWGSLLASCRVYGNVELAEVAANHLFEIEPHNAGNHVLLSNTYAASKRWDEVIEARKVLKDSEVKKVRGKSWIEVTNKVHAFMAGERNHPNIVEIYSRLDELIGKMMKMGYKGEVEHDLHNVEETRKQKLLWHHSEKLALVFGLMSLPPNAALRIMKNLRICGDCHAFMKLASRITGREIIVRDTNRFHHFTDGFCSCGEFW